MSIDNTQYQLFQPTVRGYWLTAFALVIAALVGAYCAYSLEHSGHVISGMNNSIVWGLPHVFAISLILSASGALNGATLSSVFAQQLYKPWARLSVMLAIVLLIGGLVVLVLDLGRPDRLFVAMTTYNFRSIFSWNIFLYTGFIMVGIVYLWMMFERRFNKHIRSIGLLALIWRIVLTTGTGSIFGFLVGRSALDTAIMAPLFIALSLVMGSAALSLVMMLVCRWRHSALDASLVSSLSNVLVWSLVMLFYFSIVHHLTNLNIAEHHADERFVLLGPYALLFWAGHVGLGLVIPLWLLVRLKNASADKTKAISKGRLAMASSVSLLGGMVLVYLVVVGSQSRAQELFPGKTVTASTFGDMGYARYSPSLWEWGLGFGGVSLALILLLFLLRVLPGVPVAELHSLTQSAKSDQLTAQTDAD